MGAAVYAIFSLVLVPFFLFLSLMPGPTGMQDDWAVGPAFALLLPFIYAVFGFIGSALGALIYNLVAIMMGGLEVDLEPVAGPAEVRAP